ncbi:hypothetical protein LTR86_007100 [Recurvomyces mirabilis]|nr:hypothetical protein LTR86_007100 [Recurvomyces mirabilis]
MADAENEQQITFNVKSSSEAKYVFTLAESTTIADLKQKLSTSDHADIPPERQRLIYSGRVLKDHDTVGSCKIKDGNTVHLVRGADSNQRQNPANQGGSTAVPPGAGQPASNVPSNIAAGTGAGNPLAQLTGARYAGFHGLPGMDTFGSDAGMGAPPNPDQMLRMLEDPNFAQQMNEAMNNPAVIDMLRNNPMIRNNPMARAAMENPELRRMMLNPDMIRMQMQMQRSMGGEQGGQGAFPMPGQTDTTTPAAGTEGTGATPNTTTTTGNAAQTPANPFAALFPGGAAPGGAAGTDGGASQANPFGNMFGGQQGSGQQGGDQQNNPLAQMTQQMMQNPEMMQNMMRMMGGMGGAAGAGAGAGGAGEAGFNPLTAFGGGGGAGGFGGSPEPAQPADDRPPEVRYEDQLRQLNDMGFYEFERNVSALRRSGGSVQGAVEYLLSIASTAQLVGIDDLANAEEDRNDFVQMKKINHYNRKTLDNDNPINENHDSTPKHSPIYTNSRPDLHKAVRGDESLIRSAVDFAGNDSTGSWETWSNTSHAHASLVGHDIIHQDARSGVRQGGENVSADSFAAGNDDSEDLWIWEARTYCRGCSWSNQDQESFTLQSQRQSSSDKTAAASNARQTLPKRRKHNIAKIQLDQPRVATGRTASEGEPSSQVPSFVSSRHASTPHRQNVDAPQVTEEIDFSPTNVNNTSVAFSEPLATDELDPLTPTQERYDAARQAADEDNVTSEPEGDLLLREIKLMLKPEQVDRLVRALAESPLLRNHVSRQWFDEGSEVSTMVSAHEREDTPSLTSGSSAEASPLYAQTEQSFPAEQRSPILTRDLLDDDFALRYPDHPKARRLSKDLEPQFGGIAMVDPKVHGAPVRFISRGYQQGANVLQVGHCSFVNMPFGTTVHASLRVEPASNRSINCRIMLQVVNQILDRKSSKKSYLLVAELDVTESFIRSSLLELSAHSGMSLDEIEMIAPGVRPMLKKDLDWCKLADELQTSLAITDAVGLAAASFAHLSAHTCTMQTLTLMSELERLKTRHQDFLVVRPTGYHANGMMSGISMPWISQHLEQMLYDADFMTHHDEAAKTARLLRDRVVSAITEGCSGRRSFDTRIWWGDQMRQIHCVPLHESVDGRPAAWAAFLSGESVYIPFRVSID